MKRVAGRDNGYDVNGWRVAGGATLIYPTFYISRDGDHYACYINVLWDHYPHVFTG